MDHEPLRPDRRAQRAHHPEEPRIAGRQHAHRARLASERVERVGDPRAEHDPPRARRRQRLEDRAAARHDVGAGEQRLGTRRHAAAGDAQHRDSRRFAAHAFLR